MDIWKRDEIFGKFSPRDDDGNLEDTSDIEDDNVELQKYCSVCKRITFWEDGLKTGILFEWCAECEWEKRNLGMNNEKEIEVHNDSWFI